MPFRKLNRKTGRQVAPKRRFKKKKKPRISGSLNYNNTYCPFPSKLVTNMKYVESVQVNPTALTYAYAWNMNSMFDPNRTGTGHQPMYRDTLATVYNRYRVRKCSYRITVSNLNTPARICIVPVNNTNSPADLNDASEMIYSKTMIVGKQEGGGNSIKTITGSMDLRKLLGENITDDRDQAAVGNSPSNVVVLLVLFETLDGSTNITSANVEASLIYNTEWFDKIPVTGS